MRVSIVFVAASIGLALASTAIAKEREESCFELGKRYGRCSYSAMIGKECEPEDDIVKPSRCQGDSDFDRGIKAGIEEIQVTTR